MESNNITSQPTAKLGLLTGITSVFSQPSKVFGSFTKKTEWFIPLIIIVIIAGTIGHFTKPIIVKTMMPSVMKNIEQYRDRLPEEQYNQIVARAEAQFDEALENKFVWYYPLIIIGFTLVFMLAISVVGIMSGNFFFGGKASFWMIMNVVAFAALVGLLGDVVRGLMMIAKDSGLVYTGLGLIKPHDDGSLMFYIFRQIDIFSIWRIIVTCIGLGVIYNMKASKFAMVFIPVWLIFIVIVALLNSTIMAGGLTY